MPRTVSILLITSVFFCCGVRAGQVDVTWVGPSGRDYSSASYSNAFYWAPRVVPNNGNNGDTYRVTMSSPGPLLDIDATVDALTLQQHGSFYISDYSFTSAATRNDTSAFSPANTYSLNEGLFVGVNKKATNLDLGALANYNATTSSLESGVYGAGASYNPGNLPATLSFKGAKIVTNSAGILLVGGGRITDEFGADALQSLAINNGVLEMRQSFQTAGDFTNNGQLRVIPPIQNAAAFIITGRLTNFDANNKTLTGGAYLLLSTGVALQFPGADIVTNSAVLTLDHPDGSPAIIDENGADGLRNFANNTASGSLTLRTNFHVNVPRFANAGYISLIRSFTLPSGGVFEQSDGELSVSFYGGSNGWGKLDTQGGSILLQGGRLTGGGTLVGATTSSAVISPGNGDITPRMVFTGDLTLGSSSVLRFDLGGTLRGPGYPDGSPFSGDRQYGYDAIDCTASVILDGQLQVNLSTASPYGGRFTPDPNNTFILLKSQAPIVGSFRNVANGQRLNTVDGGGSFVVNYGPNTTSDPTAVVLSDFQPNTGPAVLLNISTRGQVGSGERVMIGGFIITGSEPKPVIVRGIGPSLRSSGIGGTGIPGVLDDPVLSLHDQSGATIASNDDWPQSPQRTAIQGTGIAPSDPREPAIVATLEPGPYTAVLEGKSGATGVCLVEVYDLNAGAQSQLANMSTRAYVDTGDNVLIGGFIVGGGTGSTDILVRALGPSLSKAGVTEAMEDPSLGIYTANGTTIGGNDDWTINRASIEATGLAPSDDRESAYLLTVQPGAYTAVVRPARGKSGVGLVEFYRLR